MNIFVVIVTPKKKKLLQNSVQRIFFTHSDPRKVRFNAQVLSLPYLTVYVCKVFIDTCHPSPVTVSIYELLNTTLLLLLGLRQVCPPIFL